MGDRAIRSQEQSFLLRTLEAERSSEIFEYQIPDNFPFMSLDSTDVFPDRLPTGPVYGANLRFDGYKGGLLRGVSCRTVLNNSVATPTATLQETDRLGANFYRTIEFKSLSKSVQNCDREYVDSRINNSPSEKAQGYLNMILPIGAPGASGTSAQTEFSTPLFFWFAESAQNVLDTNFVQDWSIHMQVASSQDMWGSVEAAYLPTFDSVVLTYYFINLQDKLYDSLHLANYNQKTEDLYMYKNDSFVENPTILTSTFSSTASILMFVTADSEEVISASHFKCKVQTTGVILPINRIHLRSAGRHLQESTRLQQVFQSTLYDAAINNVPGSAGGDDSFSMMYGLDTSKVYNSGSIYFKALTSPQFEVEIDTSTLSGSQILELSCQHDTISTLIIEEGSGRFVSS